MHWGKIVLLAVFGVAYIVRVAEAEGWQPKPLNERQYALVAIMDISLFFGVWFGL